MQRYCKTCNIILTMENSYRGRRICKSCYCKVVSNHNKIKWRTDPEYRKKRLQQLRQWVANNREYFNSYMQKYKVSNWLVINGKLQKVIKRQRPITCEVCNRLIKRLVWHHWDDKHPEYGVWVCMFCHIIAETVDHINSSGDTPYPIRINNYIILKENNGKPLKELL